MTDYMAFWYLEEILTIVFGVALMTFLHILIPLCCLGQRKIRSTAALWWIAFAGGVFGNVMCSILTEEFRGISSVLISAFFTWVGFVILHGKRTKLIMEAMRQMEEENRKNRRWFSFGKRK